MIVLASRLQYKEEIQHQRCRPLSPAHQAGLSPEESCHTTTDLMLPRHEGVVRMNQFSAPFENSSCSSSVSRCTRLCSQKRRCRVTHTRTHTHTHTHTRTHTHAHLHKRARTHACTHAPTHARTHTNRHTPSLSPVSVSALDSREKGRN